MAKVIIYTDGACRKNPGPGGWGVFIKYGEHEKHLYGADIQTTNNRMELTAAIKGLQALTRPCEITIYTDSVYVKNGITQWLENWKRNNWRTASKSPVKNAALWQELDNESQRHDIIWKWIKGHAGHEGNEKADELANIAIDEMLGISKR